MCDVQWRGRWQYALAIGGQDMSTLKGLEKLIFEARNLRDYILRIEGPDADNLTAALYPFDRAAKPEDTTKEEQIDLGRAFEGTLAIALKSVDERTLSDVLIGNSPHLTVPMGGKKMLQGCANSALAFFAFILVLAAFHFSHWATKTTFIVQEAENFSAFDHFEQMMKVVELKTYFERAAPESDAADLEPQLVYLEERAALEAHYNSERTLPSAMSVLDDEFNPLRNNYNIAAYRYCTATNASEDPPAVSLGQIFFNCQSFYQLPVTNGPSIERQEEGKLALASVEDPEVTRKAPFTQSLEGFALEERYTMEAAGRAFNVDYIVSRTAIERLTQELRQKLNVVHLWALPIIYGALGSIVFSIWRVLNPNASSFNLFHSLIRMIFAGLAALTFSMLLVPSNIIAVGVDLNRPVIYLLCFIFGYSIETFVNTLNLLNLYFATNIAARRKQKE
jgi:hypothetical protein